MDHSIRTIARWFPFPYMLSHPQKNVNVHKELLLILNTPNTVDNDVAIVNCQYQLRYYLTVKKLEYLFSSLESCALLDNWDFGIASAAIPPLGVLLCRAARISLCIQEGVLSCRVDHYIKHTLCQKANIV